MRQRAACSAPHWTEEFIDPQAGATTRTEGESLVLGYSVLVVPEFASTEECKALRDEAQTVASETLENSIVQSEICAGLYDPTRVRLPVSETLSGEGKTLCDRLLVRALALVKTHQPQLQAALFGECPLSTCLDNQERSFAAGEPAVNVYSEGGRFEPHEDNHSLTILVTLSSQDDFEGGGTAFWALRDGEDAVTLTRQDEAERVPPSVVLVPPVGTALLFGGQADCAPDPKPNPNPNDDPNPNPN